MAGIVVDSSVFAAIAFDEVNADEALALVRGYEFYAPPLMAFEVTNTAWKKISRDPSQRFGIIESLSVALDTPINWTAVDFNETLALALETGLTAYDASYLYLAQTLGMPLATFDKKLHTAAHARGIR